MLARQPVLATFSCRTPTRPLRLSRRTGHGRRATCRVEDMHSRPAQQDGQRPCGQLLATNLHFVHSRLFAGSSLLLSLLHCPTLPPHSYHPTRNVALRIELADMVGLACAYPGMHANASSGRPRRERSTPTTYLILCCPSSTLRDPGSDTK